MHYFINVMMCIYWSLDIIYVLDYIYSTTVIVIVSVTLSQVIYWR